MSRTNFHENRFNTILAYVIFEWMDLHRIFHKQGNHDKYGPIMTQEHMKLHRALCHASIKRSHICLADVVHHYRSAYGWHWSKGIFSWIISHLQSGMKRSRKLIRMTLRDACSLWQNTPSCSLMHSFFPRFFFTDFRSTERVVK